jgi:hypothetical protein
MVVYIERRVDRMAVIVYFKIINNHGACDIDIRVFYIFTRSTA